MSDFFQVRAFKSTSILQTVKNFHVDGLADITVFWKELKQWSPHCQLLLAFTAAGHPPVIVGHH